MHLSLLLGACLISAVCTSLGAIAILSAHRRWQLVARGDGRAIGGPALFIGIIIATASTAASNGYLVVGGLIVVLVGLVDDLTDLSPWQKLLGQGIAAGIAAAWMVGSSQATMPPALMGLAAFVWIVLLTNAANLIDGLDGLLIGTIAPAMVVLILISVSAGDLFAVALGGACAASLIAFLPFNWSRARLLLGDTGSEFIGFSLAVLTSISFLHRPHPSAIPVFLLLAAIPLADTTFAVIRRLANHRSIFSRDKEHIHHRLARLFGERRSVAILSSLAILTSAIAFFMWHSEI